MLTAGDVQISGWIFIFRRLCRPILLRVDASLPRYLIQSFSRRAGVADIYQRGDRETWRVQPSESSARWLRAEPAGRQPGPAGCSGARSPCQGHRQSPLQPSGSTRTVGPAKFKDGSSKSTAAQDPGRGLPGPGPRPTVPLRLGATAVTQEKSGAPETTFLYLDDDARGHVSQHHAVACFVGCLAPWTVAFHELLFKLMLVQGEQRGAVLLAGRLHWSGHRSWGQERQLLAEPESPGYRAHSGQWGGKTEQTRGTHGEGLSGPESDREESLQPCLLSRLDELLQVLRSPLMQQFKGSPPIWQAGDLGNPCRQDTRPYTHTSPRPCIVYSVLSTAVHALPAGKYFLVKGPKISSKHPEVPFSQEGGCECEIQKHGAVI